MKYISNEINTNEESNKASSNLSYQVTLEEQEEITISINNSQMTALPAVFLKDVPITGSNVNLIREPYTVTPAAYGNEVVENIMSWKIPKKQFDYFNFYAVGGPLKNSYPTTDNTGWTTKDGWVLSAEGLTTPSLGDVNDGDESVGANDYAGWKNTGTKSFTIELPTARYVSSVRYGKVVSYNPALCTPGLKLTGVKEDMTEVILYDFGSFPGDTLTFPPVKLKKLVLFHDSAFGNASSTYGMLVSEVGDILTSDLSVQALVLSDGFYYSIGDNGLTNIGTSPDWSQAVDSGLIEDAWLEGIHAPELVFSAPVTLTITYGELVPQIAIQDNPIDTSEIGNITYKIIDDGGTGIKLAMSPDHLVWYVWDGNSAAFVSIGELTVDSIGADKLYNQGMDTALYNSIPLFHYENFLTESGKIYFTYGTTNPGASIIEHTMIADTPAPFLPHTTGALHLFSDRITYTANVAGDFLFIICV